MTIKTKPSARSWLLSLAATSARKAGSCEPLDKCRTLRPGHTQLQCPSKRKRTSSVTGELTVAGAGSLPGSAAVATERRHISQGFGGISHSAWSAPPANGLIRLATPVCASLAWIPGPRDRSVMTHTEHAIQTCLPRVQCTGRGTHGKPGTSPAAMCTWFQSTTARSCRPAKVSLPKLMRRHQQSLQFRPQTSIQSVRSGQHTSSV